MQFGCLMDCPGGRYGSVSPFVEIYRRLRENRPGQRGSVARWGISEANERALEILAIPSPAIPVGLQLLATDHQPNGQKHLRDAASRNKWFLFKIIYFIISFSLYIYVYIYLYRSYRLTPGTMIEWGNNWARAINFRKHNNEAFAGFFSQIGRLYNVHHIWCNYNRYILILIDKFIYIYLYTFISFRLQIPAGSQGDQRGRLAFTRLGRVCGIYRATHTRDALPRPGAHRIFTHTVVRINPSTNNFHCRA